MKAIKPQHVCEISVQQEPAESHLGLAFFSFTVDNELGGCGLVKAKVVDIIHWSRDQHLWRAFDETNEGCRILKVDGQPSGRPIIVEP